MPKKLYQYGLNDIGQNHGTTGNGCPAQSTVMSAAAATQTIEVGSSAFFYVGDVITIGGVSPSGTKTVTAIPDATHITVSVAVTAAAGAAVQDCINTSFNTDANNIWHQEANCTGNCGATIHLFVYAGYDETSVWSSAR
jgi:hypothetical protein